MVDLYKINVDELPIVLEQTKIQELLANVTERNSGSHTVEDYMAAFATARMQLWILAAPGDILGIAMTEVLTYPQRKVCRVIAAVGREREKWQDHIEGIQDWAASIGCVGMELMARPGWERIMKSHGYVKTHVQLERDL